MTSIPSWIYDPVISTTIEAKTLEFIIYTDGSGPSRNPNKNYGNQGGLGFVILKEEAILIQTGKKIVFDDLDSHTTELFAILEAIRTAHFLNLDHEKVILRTDSQHAISRIKYGVVRIKDQHLVLEILELMNFFTNLEIEWIKGHSGNEWHDMADRLAKDSKKGIVTTWNKKFNL